MRASRSLSFIVFGLMLSLFPVSAKAEMASNAPPPQTIVENKKMSLIEAASTNPDLSTFVKAAKSVNLETFLKGKSVTIFAPDNAAFAKLSPGKLDELFKPQNKEKLKEILLYHIVSGKPAFEHEKELKTKSLNGRSLDIQTEGVITMVNNAKLIDLEAEEGSEGIIDVIDTVLMP